MSLSDIQRAAARQLRELADAIDAGRAVALNLEHESGSVQLAPLADEQYVVTARDGIFSLTIKYVEPDVQRNMAWQIMNRGPQ